MAKTAVMEKPRAKPFVESRGTLVKRAGRMEVTDFIYRKDGPIARVILNRPHVRNAFTYETQKQLREIWKKLP